MARTLDEIASVVRDVARVCDIDADVVGVTRSEGDAAYVEVLVDVPDVDGPITVGLDDDQASDSLRADIAGKLAAIVRGDSAAGEPR